MGTSDFIAALAGIRAKRNRRRAEQDDPAELVVEANA